VIGVTENMDKKFKALADVTRFEIMKMIKNEPLCTGDISKEFTVSNATISHHLKYLKKWD